MRYGAASVELEVVDDGTPVGDAPDGLGLVGMRERVERCGGLLWAGRGDERGFVVRAQLPFDPVPT